MKRLIGYLTILLALINLSSCSDFIEEDPKSILRPGNFNSAQDVELALNGMYSNWGASSQGYGSETLIRLLHADDLIDNGGYITVFDTYSFSAQDFGQWDWNFYYDIINRSNFVIQGLAEIESLPDDEKNVYLGEARAVRAWGYFHLVQLFGHIPLILGPATSLNEVFPEQADIDGVYKQIIDDFDFAGQYGPDIFPEGQEIRFTKWAAKAFLSYTYLVREEWQNALDQANDIIESGKFELFDNPEELWAFENRNGSEFMLTLPGNASLKPLHLYQRCKPSGHPDGGWANFITNASAVDIFDKNDIRYQEHLWLYLIKGTDTVWYYEKGYTNVGKNPLVGKWKEKGPDAIGNVRTSNNSPIMRYANVFLIKAEALNELNGPTTESYEAINIIRRRGYGEPLYEQSPVADLPLNLGKQEFTEAILDERARELIGEAPWRLFDLRRRDLVIEKHKDQVPGISERHKLFPIPQNEIDRNPNLVQNAGY